MKVAIAHDYLNQAGGAERVVLAMASIWPDATIYTSLYRPTSTFPEFRECSVKASWLQKIPVDGGFRNLLPLFPLAFRSFGTLSEDLVISSSSGWAHGVRTRPGACHVVYCHTPARWLYGGEHLGQSKRQRMLRFFSPALGAWDRAAARVATLYVANSNSTREGIKRIYGRDAPVVYPPVDVDRFEPSPRGRRLLVVSRLLPYKRVDTVVRAAARAGIGLDVVGEGPSLKELQDLAGPSVRFHGRLPDSGITDLMQNARAVCVPGQEDFGIVPVEAQAAGKPVIAFAAGGALETVRPGVTGVLINDHSIDGFLSAVRRCDAIATSPQEIADNVRRFSPAVFKSRLLEAICHVANPRLGSSHAA
jgi:glycosyltransferase involved in cell wall biosynthesis